MQNAIKSIFYAQLSLKSNVQLEKEQIEQVKFLD